MSEARGGNVAVIGAGITGLTIAAELSRLGYKVDVFESLPGVGGLSASFRWDDFYFDYGPHEFCTDNESLKAYLRDILGDDFLTLGRHECQFFMNAEIPYPFTPVDLLRCVGAGMLSRVAYEVFKGRLQNFFWQQENYSFKRWTESRYGKTLYENYFGPYTEKVWGVDPDTLDPRTASSRISFNSIFDYMYQYFAFVFRKKNASNPHSPLKADFIYSKRGIGTLCDAIADRARRDGATIHLNSKITAGAVAGNRLRRFEVNGEPFSAFDHVVSTIPLTRFMELIGYRMPRMLRFRSMAFVFLKIPVEKLRDWLWIYFPSPAAIYQRTSEFSRFNAGMCPPGHTGVCAEISYFPEDPEGKMTDRELIDRTVADLKRDGFIPANVECDGVVRRTDFAYPVQYNGYIEWVSMMMEPLAEIENLSLAGRQALYRYCNMNECMEMGFETARNIAEGKRGMPYTPAGKWKGTGAKK